MTPDPSPGPRRSQMPLRALFLGIFVGCAALAMAGTALGLPPRAQSMLGVVGFLSLLIGSSADIRNIPLRTLAVGFGLQWMLAVLIILVPPVRILFEGAGKLVEAFLGFANQGAAFVFGSLADGKFLETQFGADRGFIFAFQALPTVIFVSSIFAVLYHLGVLQFFVRVFAWVMAKLMRTSGAETLSVTANVFLGQTEAPLIVKPFIPRMTRSELLTLMIGGMAHIAGGVMAVYIGMGADAVGILCASIMAAPASLYIAKVLLPETQTPETLGRLAVDPERPHANVIDAAAGGASDGMRLFLNIIAMLIAFVAGVAMLNALLGWASAQMGMGEKVTLEGILGQAFSPLAALVGVQGGDVPKLGKLLGEKLVLNEFYAYLDLSKNYLPGRPEEMAPRSAILAAFALAGFANIASIGIQLGGIGAMAESRRADIARNGLLALYGGFVATLLNASIAGVLLG